MITVYMQRKPCQTLGEPDPSTELDKVLNHIPNAFCYEYPETRRHPASQVDFIKRLVKADHDSYICTHSLTIIYALNNELIRNPKLEIKAYDVQPDGSLVDCMTVTDGQPWVDEAPLGWVADELNVEMNQLFISRGPSK